MNIVNDIKLDYSDVLLRPKLSINGSRSDVCIDRAFDFYHHNTGWWGLPIMSANMDTTGTKEMAKIFAKHNGVVCLHKHYSLEDIQEWFDSLTNITHPGTGWVSIGMKDDVLASLKLQPYEELHICIDVANGYTVAFQDRVKDIRQRFPNAVIMAGNVCTPDATIELIKAGADIVKIGIGPGSVCTTRLQTGVGFPQLSAVMECADAAHGLKNPENGRVGRICADGGCTTVGDICKAYGAGADFVMIGGMLAGTDECEGEWEYTGRKEYSYVHEDSRHLGWPFNKEEQMIGMGTDLTVYTTFDKEKDKTVKEEGEKRSFAFYGMSSYDAQDKYNNRADHRGSEGKRVVIPAKGPVSLVMKEIEAGIRSCCAYIGATSIKEMHKCATFVRVNNTHNRIYE
jgi:GMP reductase